MSTQHSEDVSDVYKSVPALIDLFLSPNLGCLSGKCWVGKASTARPFALQISSGLCSLTVPPYMSRQGSCWFIASFPNHFLPQVFLEAEGAIGMLPVYTAQFDPSGSAESLSLCKPWALKSPGASWLSLNSLSVPSYCLDVNGTVSNAWAW